MNQADERRLHEIEERLENFESPEPPEGLLTAIQNEAEAQLGPTEPPRDTLPWRLIAASLAVVAVGGLFGHRFLVDGPQPGDLGVSASRATSSESVAASSDSLGTREELGAEVAEPEIEEAETSSVVGEDRNDRRTPQDHAAETPAPSVRGATNDVADGSSPSPAGTAPASPEGEAEDREPTKAREPISRELGAVADGASESAAGSAAALQSQRADIEEKLQQLEFRAPTELRAQAPRGAPRVMADAVDEGLPARPRRKERSKSPGLLHLSPTRGSAEPNDEPYGDMFFQGYGTNPFVDTEDDPRSTFGIDVDTGSYTMTRSYLRRGQLPPVDAVRVEEFINYFDYGDPAPRRHDFAVVAEGAPSPFTETARTQLLRFALKAREIDTSSRAPAVLTFVVDVSGSMNRENRLGLVKRALRLLVDQLDEGDAVGLVVYGSRGEVLLSPTHDHRRVLAAIDRLRPGGSTNAEEGLMLAYEEARRAFERGAINRVILCSDGVANVGRTGPGSILARIASEAEEGIELTTVGFGMGNYNDVLMEQLADRGDGNYAYVDDIDAARRVFVENLTGTLQTIAADAKVQVEFESRAVQSYRLLGYENRDVADRDFRNDSVDAGEIGAGHQVTALYEVKLREGAPRSGRLATLRLRYRSKASGEIVEDAVELERRDLASRWSGATPGLRLAAVAAEFAEVLRGSYWARDAGLEGLARQARELQSTGVWDRDVAELLELIETAARLRAGRPPAGDAEPGFER